MRPETINDIPVSLIATVGLTWNVLDDEKKAVLHLAATWPPDFIEPENLREKVKSIIDDEGRMERSIAESVDILGIAITVPLRSQEASP